MAYVPKTDWGTLNGKYVSDFQPQSETMTWDFEVVSESPSPEPISLEFSDVDHPEGRRVLLEDHGSGRIREIVPPQIVDLPAASTGRYRLYSTTGNLPDGLEPTAPTNVLRARPNPFLSATELSLVASEPGRLRVMVFDSRGRLVRRLHDRQVTWGEIRIPWDGRDDSGRQLAGGVFFVRYEVGETRNAMRLVKLH